jgi:nucleoside-diphosphate-sugar epimerase
MSTTAVYGLAPFPIMWPIAEDSPLAAHGSRTLRLYGWSKIEAEKAVIRTHQLNGLEYAILRPTVVYGSGSIGAERLLSMLVQFPNLMRFEVAPNGVIQWMHVSDLVELMTRTMRDRAAANQVFNAAGGAAVSLVEVSAALRMLLGPAWAPLAPLVPPPARSHVPPFAIAKARRLLRFQPRMQIVEGLAEMFGSADGDGVRSGGDGAGRAPTMGTVQ